MVYFATLCFGHVAVRNHYASSLGQVQVKREFGHHEQAYLCAENAVPRLVDKPSLVQGLRPGPGAPEVCMVLGQRLALLLDVESIRPKLGSFLQQHCQGSKLVGKAWVAMSNAQGLVASSLLDNPEALLRVLHRLEKKKKENVKGKLTNKLYPASLA
ncbi:hypothetical protein ABBQ38_014377 [Trebouxia sp. C0009 RCD-2024]